MCVSQGAAHFMALDYYRGEAGAIYAYAVGTFPAILTDETHEYAHGVLGDAVEYKTIALSGIPVTLPDGLDAATLPPASAFRFTLPPGRVFEDIEARPIQSPAQSWLMESGSLVFTVARVAIVEADAVEGARLAIYGAGDDGIRRVASTPPIGRGYRWLAPAGIEDFDGDGRTDIAYVETPHLAGILRIVTQEGDALVPIAAPMAGFSNHAIGEDFITGGVRLCRPRAVPVERDGLVQTRHPELLVPSRDRTVLHAVRIENGALVVEDRPEPPTPAGIRAAQTCPQEDPAQ